MTQRASAAILILITNLFLALSARAQQNPVAPGFSPAPPAVRPAKPFTKVQVSSMVRDGFGDESGAKLIEQQGSAEVRVLGISSAAFRRTHVVWRSSA